MPPDPTTAKRGDLWVSSGLGATLLFGSGFGWGCFLWSHWLVGGIAQAVALGALARLGWEERRAR